MKPITMILLVVTIAGSGCLNLSGVSRSESPEKQKHIASLLSEESDLYKRAVAEVFRFENAYNLNHDRGWVAKLKIINRRVASSPRDVDRSWSEMWQVRRGAIAVKYKVVFIPSDTDVNARCIKVYIPGTSTFDKATDSWLFLNDSYTRVWIAQCPFYPFGDMDREKLADQSNDWREFVKNKPIIQMSGRISGSVLSWSASVDNYDQAVRIIKKGLKGDATSGAK